MSRLLQPCRIRYCPCFVVLICSANGCMIIAPGRNQGAKVQEMEQKTQSARGLRYLKTRTQLSIKVADPVGASM